MEKQTEQKLNIIIVDDNKIFLDGVKYYLEEIKSYNVINTAKNGEEFLALNNIHEADIILMDIEMPKLNGIKATEQILLRENQTKVIAITNYEDKAYLSEFINNGFKGCVFKNNIHNEIERAIQTVMSGMLYYTEDIEF